MLAEAVGSSICLHHVEAQAQAYSAVGRAASGEKAMLCAYHGDGGLGGRAAEVPVFLVPQDSTVVLGQRCCFRLAEATFNLAEFQQRLYRLLKLNLLLQKRTGKIK